MYNIDKGAVQESSNTSKALDVLMRDILQNPLMKKKKEKKKEKRQNTFEMIYIDTRQKACRRLSPTPSR